MRILAVLIFYDDYSSLFARLQSYNKKPAGQTPGVCEQIVKSAGLGAGYTHYEQSPKINSVYAADTQPITAMASISVAIAFITAAFFFILLNIIKTSFINRIYYFLHFVH